MIKNNIFYSNADPDLNFAASSTGITSSNNLWYRASGDVLSYNSSTYTTANITTFEATAKATDPLLTAAYRLGSGSPAIDAGVAISGLHSGSTIVGGDAAGNTTIFGDGVDIGAYEYGPAITMQGVSTGGGVSIR
jgi:hypothetical protein